MATTGMNIKPKSKYQQNIDRRLKRDSESAKAFKKYEKTGDKDAYEKKYGKTHSWGRGGKRRHERDSKGNIIHRKERGGTEQEMRREEDRQSNAKRAQIAAETYGPRKQTGKANWTKKHGSTHDFKTGKRKPKKPETLKEWLAKRGAPNVGRYRNAKGPDGKPYQRTDAQAKALWGDLHSQAMIDRKKKNKTK